MSDQNSVNNQINDLQEVAGLISYEAKVITKQMVHPVTNFIVMKS